jgi:hypothetical protein
MIFVVCVGACIMAGMLILAGGLGSMYLMDQTDKAITEFFAAREEKRLKLNPKKEDLMYKLTKEIRESKGFLGTEKSILKPIRDSSTSLNGFLQHSNEVRQFQSDLFKVAKSNPSLAKTHVPDPPQPISRSAYVINERAKKKTKSEFASLGYEIPVTSDSFIRIASARRARFQFHGKMIKSWKVIGKYETGLQLIFKQITTVMPWILDIRTSSSKPSIDKVNRETLLAWKLEVLESAQSDLEQLRNGKVTLIVSRKRDQIVQLEDLIKIFLAIPV